MAEQIYAEDSRYPAIHAAWVSEGKPYKLLFRSPESELPQAYVAAVDNDILYFITIDRDDPSWLDPNDPKKQWHGAYGFLGVDHGKRF